MRWYWKLNGDDRKKFLVLDITYKISGILLLVAGITSECVFWRYNHFLDSSPFEFAVHVILLGLSVLILTILAYHGLTKGTFFKTLFFVSLVVVVVFEFVIAGEGWMYFTYTNWVVHFRYPHNYGNRSDPLLKLWDTIQSEFHCCGESNYVSWEANLPESMSGELPLSCCMPPQNLTNFKCTSGKDAYGIGCVNPLEYRLKSMLIVSTCFLIIFPIAQVATAILLLLKHVKLNCDGMCPKFVCRNLECKCTTVAAVNNDCNFDDHFGSRKEGGNTLTPE